MVDNISNIQQLFAESKFAEIQREVELLLFRNESSVTIELLEIYFHSLKSLSHKMPEDLLLSLVERLLPGSPDKAEKWLSELTINSSKFHQRKLLIEIRIAELKGKTEDLYNLVTRFQLYQFENQIPMIPEEIVKIINKYFAHDFKLRLQALAFEILRKDLAKAEVHIKSLILSCFEKSSPKGTKDKLDALYVLLNSSGGIQHLEVFRNLCYLYVNGISEKSDYKKIIELVLYIEEFEMQTVVLNLLVREKLFKVAQTYADEIRTNKKYSYVYFDKYFTELKFLFYKKNENNIVESRDENKNIDLSIGVIPSYPFYHEILSEISDEEILVTHLLKHQSFSTNELLEIATSFVQSEFYLAALQACELANQSTDEVKLKLKAYYLKIICLLKRGDCRAALDESLNALSLSESQNDILSFLYSQTEALLRLKEYTSAKNVLEKILRIDNSYRMAKERLDRLNAI